MTTAAGEVPWAIPALFARLVDDTSLLRRRNPAPDLDAVLAGYLAARDGTYGGLVGQLACPVSRLPALVAALARTPPGRPVELSLVVDTGLGAVPKALSAVLSRPSLVLTRTVETTAPTDVDATWLERVAEFVPDDVAAVVEPCRPQGDAADELATWLDAVRRVAERGCVPKLRCGGPRPSDVPPAPVVEQFVRVVLETGSGFTAAGLARAVRPEDGADAAQHGVLNLLVAVARVVAGGVVTAALASTDGAALVAEVTGLPERAGQQVRALLTRCGADQGRVSGAELAGLGALA